MLYENFNDYPEHVRELVSKLTRHQCKMGDNNNIIGEKLTDDEKKEFMLNLKKFIDLDCVEFTIKMLTLSQICTYSKDVIEYLMKK